MLASLEYGAIGSQSLSGSVRAPLVPFPKISPVISISKADPTKATLVQVTTLFGR